MVHNQVLLTFVNTCFQNHESRCLYVSSNKFINNYWALLRNMTSFAEDEDRCLFFSHSLGLKIQYDSHTHTHVEYKFSFYSFGNFLSYVCVCVCVRVFLSWSRWKVVRECSVLQCIAVCCGVLRCVAVCCGVLQVALVE